VKKSKQAHSMNQKFGMGSYMGRALNAKMGKIRGMYEPGENPPTPKKLKKPPKSLA